MGQCVLSFSSVYAPQSSLSDAVKDQFYDQLPAVTARIPASELLIPCEKLWCGFREVISGLDYGRLEPSAGGERIMGYVLAFYSLLILRNGVTTLSST